MCSFTWPIFDCIYVHNFPSSSVGKESACNAGDPGSIPGLEDPLEKGSAPHSSVLGLPWWLSWLRIHLQCETPGFDPGMGRSPGEGNCYPPQYSGLEISMDCIVHVVTKSQTQPGDFHFHHNYFFHSPVHGHLAYFHVQAIVNSAAINTGVHVSLLIMACSGYMPSSEIVRSYGSFIPSILRNIHIVLHSGCMNLLSH